MRGLGIKPQRGRKELRGARGGEIGRSTASSVPSGRGREVIATLASALTSAREALTTPPMRTLSLSTSLSSAPSRDLTAKLLPSSFSMVPRTRTFCAWAATELNANVAANVATTKTCDVILISFPLIQGAHGRSWRIQLCYEQLLVIAETK